MVRAVADVGRERNTFHLVTEVDVAAARGLLARHRERTGERLSFTAYVVACLARACAAHPALNSFRRGRRLVILDDVTIGVLFERVLDGERVPDVVGIRRANRKSYREINAELRAAQARDGEPLGASGGLGCMRFVPGCLLRPAIRLASQSIEIQRRFGVVSVTAVGMHGAGPMWPLPLSSATVCAAVGTITPRVVLVDGLPEEREHLCVTLSFDHDIVDGAPAARFARSFAEIVRRGDEARSVTG